MIQKLRWNKIIHMYKKKINKKETGEDATKYGEFVSSFFGWITPKHQKERAEELEKLDRTKKK